MLWWILLCLFLLLCLAGWLAGNYFYRLALVPGSSKGKVFDAPQNKVDEAVYKQQQAGKDWLAAVPVQRQVLRSEDGLALSALWIRQPQPSPLWVIACHGYTARAEGNAYIALRFYEQGYNVVLPDARGHGQSEGGYIGMGWPERRDIVGWVGEILKEDPQARILLYGISMGGATVLMASGETLPPNVRAVVDDCGYTSAWDEFAHQLRATFHLPVFPLLHLASLVTRIRAGYWLGEASALAAVGRSTLPTLFVHGEEDTFVPAEMGRRLHEAAGDPKQLLPVPGAGHGGASARAGEEYWDTIWRFTSPWMGPESAGE